MLSASVANALEYHGDSDCTETAAFVRLFDRFFDCFNVRSIDESIIKRKPDLRPYRGPLDTRLSVSSIELDILYSCTVDNAITVAKRHLSEVSR